MSPATSSAFHPANKNDMQSAGRYEQEYADNEEEKELMHECSKKRNKTSRASPPGRESVHTQMLTPAPHQVGVCPVNGVNSGFYFIVLGLLAPGRRMWSRSLVCAGLLHVGKVQEPSRQAMASRGVWVAR